MDGFWYESTELLAPRVNPSCDQVIVPRINSFRILHFVIMFSVNNSLPRSGLQRRPNTPAATLVNDSVGQEQPNRILKPDV